MAFPFVLAAFSPAGITLARTALGALLSHLAVKESNKYLNGGDNTEPTTAIPTTKTPPTKSSNISALSSMNNSIASGQDSAKTSITSSVNSAITDLTSKMEATKAANQTLLNAVKDSPLLGNQVVMKDSIDNLVGAINNQTVASVTVLGTLDSHLSSIAGVLSAISATLLKISGNYEAQLDNTGDVPFINSADYYKMLAESGMSADKVNDYLKQEEAYTASLKSSGVTNYNDIKKAVADWRTKTIPTSNQDYVGDVVGGLTKGWSATTTRTTAKNALGENVSLVETVPKTTTATAPNVSLEVPNLEKWAGAALGVANAMSPEYVARDLYARTLKNEFVTTQTQIKDLDGNLVANIKPMEATAIKAATEARLRTDMNSIEESDMDLDENFPDFDLSALFTFDKKSSRLTELLSNLPSRV